VDISNARKRLEEMRDGLDRSIMVLQGERPGPYEGAGYPGDPADAGANLSETDRVEAVLDSARRQRVQVLAAIGRIEQDCYGNCVDCGKCVPDGRLEARPDASRCVACQAKSDRRRR
jgi:RNA polymerase-binding transcription factor DksA